MRLLLIINFLCTLKVAEIILKTMQGLYLNYPVVSDEEKSQFDGCRARINSGHVFYRSLNIASTAE